MADISTNFGESTSNIDDSPREKNTENVFCEEPPPYQSLCSESINYPSTPITVCPSYSTLTYNINSTSALIDPQPTITQSNGKIKSYELWSIFNILCCAFCLGIVWLITIRIKL